MLYSVMYKCLCARSYRVTSTDRLPQVVYRIQVGGVFVFNAPKVYLDLNLICNMNLQRIA